MGLSLEDFESLSLPEFHEVVRCFREREEREQMAAWKRSRFEAMYMLQPYSKHGVRPQDICVFPWEQDTAEKKDIRALQEEALKRLAEMEEG